MWSVNQINLFAISYYWIWWEGGWRVGFYFLRPVKACPSELWLLCCSWRSQNMRHIGNCWTSLPLAPIMITLVRILNFELSSDTSSLQHIIFFVFGNSFFFIWLLLTWKLTTPHVLAWPWRDVGSLLDTLSYCPSGPYTTYVITLITHTWQSHWPLCGTISH